MIGFYYSKIVRSINHFLRKKSRWFKSFLENYELGTFKLGKILITKKYLIFGNNNLLAVLKASEKTAMSRSKKVFE
jgi:hypothetical protein